MTTCPGAFRFAGETTCRDSEATSAHARATPAASSPRIAAIAPSPTGTASCMYRPLRRTVRRASAKDSVPAATCAEYSPRLCPAAKCARTPSRFDETMHGSAHRKDRRLRVLREDQAVLRPVEAQGAQRLAERRIRFRERVAANRELPGQRLTHPDLLGTLPGKHERDHASFSSSPSLTARAAIVTAFRTALADERPWPDDADAVHAEERRAAVLRVVERLRNRRNACADSR